MERFIVSALFLVTSNLLFKIQYGEIYRRKTDSLLYTDFLFKIQYGEIYSSPS